MDCAVASAETLNEALSYAYTNNPQINAQRAAVRATDENVPTALDGYRPRVVATANVGFQSLSTKIREIGSTTPPGSPASYFTQSGTTTPHGYGATITQTLLNGFQTANRTLIRQQLGPSQRAKKLPKKILAAYQRLWILLAEEIVPHFSRQGDVPQAAKFCKAAFTYKRVSAGETGWRQG